ncbi:MAG: 5-methyltetrahydropteroyltriglutamate--homocysteine S-methyltransferase [Lactobacillales bacterium]|jgi:5-methyltetrahydropteroyltriglutamate--homocysteine methyltransferase|nr:5-methyltetrahydropteroyltriglutamate--homocysteine S-methyltransferase [Lactobacillales bacterium]
MSRTSIIGFPRIGENRELKFATEKYFKKEISENELQIVASNIRKQNWHLQKKADIEFIPSNDFSFYDQMLDTAIMLNVVPKRYKELNLNVLDTYFAMARGYQGENGDVKALSMKKWFNTNYHYLVPEFDKTIKIQLNTTKIFDELCEATLQNIQTKPVIIGPFTFLKLATFKDGVKSQDFYEDLIKVYSLLLEKLSARNVNWVQLDEPSLVCDLTKEDIELFKHLYQSILIRKEKTHVLLQTYFGDVRDSYQDIIQLNFDGFGLDFVEGKETINLLNQFDFPKTKILFAGVINGKNIWRNNYQKTLDLLRNLPNCFEVIINSSCSLQHVPLTVKAETKLADSVKQHLSFAIEKLIEIREIKDLLNHFHAKTFEKNQALFKFPRTKANTKVSEQIKELTKAEFNRQPSRKQRREIQTKELNLPLLPTTTIGSFPQTAEVRKQRFAYKKERISKKNYAAFIKEQINKWIIWQESIGIDVLVHGEFERNDMVEYFGENLNGYIFTKNAWVQSYGNRFVKPPIVWNDVSRKQAITVTWTSYAQSLSEKYIKGMLTGPVTILNWSFPREDISLKEQAYQIALAIREEVLDLESAGISIIQIDEAALREKLPLRKSDWQSEYLDWAVKAFCLVHSQVSPKTQIHTHMCYSEFEEIIPTIDLLDADVISFEASRSDLSILSKLRESNFETLVGPGVYDIHSPRIPSVKEIEEAIEKILTYLPAKQVWINPDCGLKTRGILETKASLKNIVQATQAIRKQLT